MPSYSSDRRSILKIIGAIGATCAPPFAGDELYAETPQQPKAARFFNERDYATISRIADLIIPQTDTPGAVGAGVPEYIDQAVSRNTDYQLLVSDGLRWLDAQAEGKFMDLSEEKQLAILQPLCDAYDNKQGRYVRSVQFFSLIKNLTADGYYTSQVGLMKELGYKNSMLPSYPGCT